MPLASCLCLCLSPSPFPIYPIPLLSPPLPTPMLCNPPCHAGQERFRTITASYYRGAHGIIIVFDITDAESFENVKDWLQEIDNYACENVNKLLIGNKCDLADKRAVSAETAAEFAEENGMTYLETSAKDNLNVTQSFETLAGEISERIASAPAEEEEEADEGDKADFGRGESVDTRSSGGCC